MKSVPRNPDDLTLELIYLAPDRVDFTARYNGNERAVRVEVGSGTSWRWAVQFPTVRTWEGSSLGDDALDEQVRIRAAEELVRLDAATRATRAAGCAA